MIELFNEIVASLRAGHYTRVKPDGEASYFTELPITDDAELFNEASKTLLYYWCLANGEERWCQYYDTVCVPTDTPELRLTGIPFLDVVKIVSPDAVTEW